MPDILGPYRRLPGSIYILFFANIVNSVGNFVWPLLTLLLTDKLGMGEAEAGFYVTISIIAFAPGSLLGGKLVDHLGRKRIFLSARFIAAFCLVPCAFLGSSMTIVWLLMATCVTHGIADPAISAMVADLTNSANRQTAFSLLYLGHNIGFAVGPMIAGLLYQHHLPWLFLGDALTTLLSIVLIGLFVKETFVGRRKQQAREDELSSAERAEEGGLIPVLLRRPALLAFSTVLMILSFVYVQSTFSLPLQIGKIFGEDGPRLFGLLMSINALTVVLLTVIVARLTAANTPERNVGLGALLYAVGFGMIFVLDRLAFFIISTVVWTIGEILVATNTGAYIANNSPISHRGRFNSVLGLVSGTGHTLGPTVAGGLIARFGVRMIWPVCFILASGAAFAIRLLGAGRNARSGPTRSAPI